MGSKQSIEDIRDIAQTALLRALCIQKMFLNNQINHYTIRSYLKINISSKHLQESFHFSCMIKRKIIEIHQLNARLKHYRHVKPSKSRFLTQLEKFAKARTLDFIEIQNLESSILTEVKELQEIHELYLKIHEIHKAIKEKSLANQAVINENSRKAIKLIEVKNEISDMYHYIKLLKGFETFLGYENEIKVQHKLKEKSKIPQNTLFLVEQRKKLEEKKQFLETLKQRVNQKLKAGLKSQKENSINRNKSFEITEPSLELKLEALKAKESRLLSKIDYYKSHDFSSVSTNENLSNNESSTDWLQSCKLTLNTFLTDIRPKRIHISEIPFEFT